MTNSIVPPAGSEPEAREAVDWAKDAAPFSARWNWPVLKQEQPTPLSDRLGLPTTSQGVPFGWLGSPRFALSSMFGLGMLSDNATPLSSRFDWQVLSPEATPLSTKFGWSV